MSFMDFWKEIEKLHMLPSMAIDTIPLVLSSDTKERLSRKTPIEAIQILNCAIEQINNGSIETLDMSVRKRLSDKAFEVISHRSADTHRIR